MLLNHYLLAVADHQDRLRGQYHALSADPNSLANLDQDLPNSMQDQIPIFTLDQDWLWCQTWCSDESLTTAKTSEQNLLRCLAYKTPQRRSGADWTSRSLPESHDKRTQIS